MLTVPDMIANGVPDAPPKPTLGCYGCEHLVTRTHPAGTAGPHSTSARCKQADAQGARVIGWEWQPHDQRPHWCPKRRAA